MLWENKFVWEKKLTGECFRFSRTSMSISISRQKHEEHVFCLFRKIAAIKKQENAFPLIIKM